MASVRSAWRCVLHAALRSFVSAAVLTLCLDITAANPLILSPTPGHVHLDASAGPNVVVLGLPGGRFSLLVSLNFMEAFAALDAGMEIKVIRANGLTGLPNLTG